MALPVQLLVKENAACLRKRRSQVSPHLHPRIKMLQGILQGIHKNNALAAHTGSGLRSIIRWKSLYQQGGIDLLLEEKRGGDMRSQFDERSHAQLAHKLSNPVDAFTSYDEARAWIKKELGIELSYMATWLYLRRNFGTKLKVGRKSHVKKDEAAVAVFKKSTESHTTY